jgi:hypothetical protein
VEILHVCGSPILTGLGNTARGMEIMCVCVSQAWQALGAWFSRAEMVQACAGLKGHGPAKWN